MCGQLGGIQNLTYVANLQAPRRKVDIFVGRVGPFVWRFSAICDFLDDSFGMNGKQLNQPSYNGIFASLNPIALMIGVLFVVTKSRSDSVIDAVLLFQKPSDSESE